MKIHRKRKIAGRSLRAVFLAVCFWMAACLLMGCGREDDLLSELRRESTAAGNEAESDNGTDGETSAGAGADKESGAEAGGKNPQSPGQEENVPDAGGLTEPGTIFVHVCGAVAYPGVYEMPEGSRFFEAVETAGGFREDACQDYLNMAAPLADGSRLEIPTLEEIREKEEAGTEREASGGGSGMEEYSYYTVPETAAKQTGGTDPASGLVNINTADIAQLCTLPGIGEGRAKAVIEYREKQGGFQKKEDIMQVSGIGEKMYARMEAYLVTE